MATIPAIATALFTSLTSVGIVSYLNGQSEVLPSWVVSLIILLSIPAIAYGSSLGMSVLVRYRSKCKSVDFQNIALGNLMIALSTFITGLVISFENIPILKYIFGEYEPYNRMTGLSIPKDAIEYNEYMISQTHYKIQTLSNIVKDALPFALSDTMKDGMVYLYYMFFMTLLPAFFIFTAQATCK